MEENIYFQELFGSSFEEIMGAFIVSPGYRLASPDVIKVIKNIKVGLLTLTVPIHHI